MMYVEFMKNFLLVDSSELIALRVISASWEQKRLIPTFLDMMYVEFMKNFHLASSYVLTDLPRKYQGLILRITGSTEV